MQRNQVKHTFKTQQGTELPVLDLRGQEYLEVKYRLVWFREEHPNWSIETSIIETNDKHSIAKTIIKDDTGRALASAHKREDASHFADHLEKAESGSMGRALAMIGFGTQFCGDDLYEGDRIVDAPAAPKPYQAPQIKAPVAALNERVGLVKPVVAPKVAVQQELAPTPSPAPVDKRPLLDRIIELEPIYEIKFPGQLLAWMDQAFTHHDVALLSAAQLEKLVDHMEDKCMAAGVNPLDSYVLKVHKQYRGMTFKQLLDKLGSKEEFLRWIDNMEDFFSKPGKDGKIPNKSRDWEETLVKASEYLGSI